MDFLVQKFLKECFDKDIQIMENLKKQLFFPEEFIARKLRTRRVIKMSIKAQQEKKENDTIQKKFQAIIYAKNKCKKQMTEKQKMKREIILSK